MIIIKKSKTNNNYEYKNITYKCFNEEIKENGFRVAFGISIIIVGIFSLFYDTTNTILVGISISSLLFAIVDIFNNRNNLLYILPLSILLLFCIFPNVPIINPFLETKFNNFIVFISFGSTFCIYSISSYKNRLSNANDKVKDDLRYKDIVISQYENAIIILETALKIRKNCIKNKFINEDLNDLLTELESYADQESVLATIKDELIELGISKNSKVFNIDDIEKIIIKSGKFSRNTIYEDYPKLKKNK